MFELLRFNKNDNLKQLHDIITTPVMIIKVNMWNNDGCDTFLNSPVRFFTLDRLLHFHEDIITTTVVIISCFHP